MTTTRRTKAGQPTSYRPKYDEQVFQLCALGAIDREIADFFNVSESTVNNWKQGHPQFLESLKKGKLLADTNVAHALYQRAIGYSHPDVHISQFEGRAIETKITKYYPPDTTACIFWPKNRRPDLWRDVHRLEHTSKDGGNIRVEMMSPEERQADMIRRGELDANGRLIQKKNS